jgi:hypothetical protein
MTIWPKPKRLEGRAEIYLRWKNLAIIAIVMLLPLIIALFFNSLVVKIICWVISLLAYISFLRFQGPCIMAIAIGAVPWYIYFELEFSPIWFLIVVFVVSLIEISYIQNRMRFIKEMREKEGIHLFS